MGLIKTLQGIFSREAAPEPTPKVKLGRTMSYKLGLDAGRNLTSEDGDILSPVDISMSVRVMHRDNAFHQDKFEEGFRVTARRDYDYKKNDFLKISPLLFPPAKGRALER